MPVEDQGVSEARYMLIPRTAIFLRRGESYLLLRGAAHKKRWAGKYNCLGGHVERGEDVKSAALRELREEAGLEADLTLCGTVIVDAGLRGICLYVYVGEEAAGEIRGSNEGEPEWVEYQRLEELPVVEDLPEMLARVHAWHRGEPAFSARSSYNGQGRLTLVFAA